MSEPAVIFLLNKQCKRCCIVKPINAFSTEKRNRDGFSGTCRACGNLFKKNWAGKNPNYHNKWRKEINPESHKRAREKEKTKAKENRRLKRIESGKSPLEPRATAEGRRCSACHQRLPITAFSPCPSEADGLHTYCKPCCSIKSTHWIKQNKKRLRPRLREHERKARYGLEPDTFYRMAKEQNGVCKICSIPLHDGLRGACVDHNHKTGFIRGILCVKCNAGLGQFRDNIEFLLSAIEYLKLTDGY